MALNKETQEVIERIEKCTENYGKIFDYDKVLVAMNKHYLALGIPIPKVVVIDNVEAAYSAARDAARDAAWGAAWGAARDAAWGAAWGAAAINTGLKDEKTLKFIEIELALLEALEAGLGFFFPMRDQLILIPVPKFKLDTIKNLHSDSTKAIEWKDGTGYYYLHGVKFPENLWIKVVSKQMPFAEIMAIVDVDQRTQAMKYGDFHDFAKLQKAKRLDRHTKLDINGEEVKYELWEFPKGDIFQKNVHFMWYQCPSTRNEYTSGVWESKTVAEAMARKQGITEKMWLLQVPLVHES